MIREVIYYIEYLDNIFYILPQTKEGADDCPQAKERRIIVLNDHLIVSGPYIT